jgi:hypothetical protein
MGIIVRNSVTSVSVDWEGVEGFTHYTAADARYEVDRGRWRITPPVQQNIFDLMGKGYDKGMLDPAKNSASPALTGDSPHGKIDSSPHEGANLNNRGDAAMATRKTTASKKAGAKQKALAEEFNTDPIEDVKLTDTDDELDDDEVEVDEIATGDVGIVDDEDEADDEVDDTADDEADDLPERETYTAKQVATRIGTDAKTLRKFFRSPASTVEPVGQGGRYEFDAADLPKIRDEFTKWNTTKTVRTPKEKKAAAPKGRQAPAGAELIEEDDEILELDDEDEEPTDDELDDIESDVEVDDDDELDD